MNVVKQFKEEFNIADNELTSDTWCTGGITGNSCWGCTNTPVTPEPEADFYQLDDFLEEHFEKITFFQYRKILRLVKINDVSYGYDYYGNYSIDYKKVINIKDLVSFLIEQELWIP